MSVKILTYLPHYIHPYGIGYAAHSLAVEMNSDSIHSDIFSIISDFASEDSHVKQAIPSRFLYKLLSKFIGNDWITRFTEKKLRRIAKNYDVIFLWPGCSIETYRYLKGIGKTIIVEYINCHVRTSKEILDTEAERAHLTDTHHISNEKLLEEDERLKLADFVMSPSPEVTKSLINNNVDAAKIFESSYGLGQHQLLAAENKDDSEITFLFVGSVIMRKGVHLLLEYWEYANVNAKLKIVGRVEPSMNGIIEKYKKNKSIEFIPFTNNLELLYQSADVFIMNSLEEGSPLVTYLALGAGLPCVVSPMAGDGVIRDQQEGFLIDTFAKDKWASSIRELTINKELREKMSFSSSERAQHFLWPLVASRRAKFILNKIGL